MNFSFQIRRPRKSRDGFVASYDLGLWSVVRFLEKRERAVHLSSGYAKKEMCSEKLHLRSRTPIWSAFLQVKYAAQVMSVSFWD